jgi:hypothetical protein
VTLNGTRSGVFCGEKVTKSVVASVGSWLRRLAVHRRYVLVLVLVILVAGGRPGAWLQFVVAGTKYRRSESTR